MIDILNTQGYSLEDFGELIAAKLEENQKLEIVIPKCTQQFSSSSENIAYDYLRLATIGQILFDASIEFEYEQVPPTINKSIVFILIPKNAGNFKKLLMEVALFFKDNLDDEDELFAFEKQEEFLEFAEKNKVACHFFYDKHVEFSQELTDEDLE